MARRTATQNTGNTPFTGTQYAKFLATRQSAMKGFAEGTVTATEKGAARAQVRNARKAITATGMTVEAWREAEKVRETPSPKVRGPRQPKTEQVTESVPE